MSKAEKPLKKLTFVYKKTNSEEFIKYFKPMLQKNFKHNFVSRRQNKQFKAYVLSFPKNIVMSIVDLTENYSFKVQNEI
jgi:16S rRNA G527 N7-methylase RsmG